MFVLVCVLCLRVSWNNSLNNLKGPVLKKAALLMINSIIRSMIKIKIQPNVPSVFFLPVGNGLVHLQLVIAELRTFLSCMKNRVS